jgi:ABC-type nickel/cobalt efflux system permease component RcnA
MADILKTILLFILLFGVGTVLLVVAFALCVAASKKAESEMNDEKEEWK